MAVWVIRAGKEGENESFTLNKGVYGVGPYVNRSVTDFTDRAAWRNSVPVERSLADEIWRFSREMEVGEMVVMPLRGAKKVAVGRIVGDYVYCYVERPDQSLAPLPHTRKVEWLVEDAPLANFDQDLQNSFKNAESNVVRCRKLDPEARIQQVVDDYLGQG